MGLQTFCWEMYWRRRKRDQLEWSENLMLFIRSFWKERFHHVNWHIKLIDWLINWLIDWLIDWLVGWLVGWLIWMGHAVRRNDTNLILHTCIDYELVHDIGIVNAIQSAWHSEAAPMLFAHDAVWEQAVEPYAPLNGYVVGSNWKIQIHLQTTVSKSHLKDHHPSPVVTKRLLPQFAKAKLCKTFVAVSHFSCEACRSTNPAWHPEPPIGFVFQRSMCHPTFEEQMKDTHETTSKSRVGDFLTPEKTAEIGWYM